MDHEIAYHDLATLDDLLEESAHLGLIIFKFDLEEHALAWVSESVRGIMGYDRMELDKWSVQKIRSVVHPSDSCIFNKYLAFMLRRETGDFRALIRLRHKRGKYVSFAGSSFISKSDHIVSPGLSTGVLLKVDGLCPLSSPLEKSVENSRMENMDLLDTLTRRELEVLCFFSKGYHCREIAAKLNLSFHTIDTYRKILLRKLRLRNVASLAAFAGECGLH